VCAGIRGCEYEREDKKPCDYHRRYGKFQWKDPNTAEEKSYCIFHAPIEVKKDLIDVFWERFRAYVNETREEFDKADGEGKKRISLDCEGFVFPPTVEKTQIKLGISELPYNVVFKKAVFTGEADFMGILFKNRTLFTSAVFKGETTFCLAEFNGYVNFSAAVFCGKTNFHQATFKENVSFAGAKFFHDIYFSSVESINRMNFTEAYFRRNADFRNARFKGEPDFGLANFCGDAVFQDAEIGEFGDNGTANFGGAFFASKVNFERVKFLGKAIFGMSKKLRNFRETTFAGKVVFNEALFNSYAGLYHCIFENEVQFERVIFDIPFPGAADFGDTAFRKRVTFFDARFNCWARFLRTEFHGEAFFKNTVFIDWVNFTNVNLSNRGNLYLKHTLFDKPHRAVIKECDMAYWSFVGTNIEGIRFIGVEWRKNVKNEKEVFDRDLAKNREISWGETVDVYRCLRLNFENKLAYEYAGDFHVGEMECRLRDDKRGFGEKLLLRLYKYISGYGENIALPLAWLLLFGSAFVAISIFDGFPGADGKEVNWNWDLTPQSDGLLYVKTIAMAVSFVLRTATTFGFVGQVTTANEPCSELLLFLSPIWKLLTITLITFFILALRRRFKR